MQYSRLYGLVVRTADSYTCGRWFDSYPTYFFLSFCLFIFGALRPRQQIFSNVGTSSIFIGWTSSKQWITCVIVTALEVSLELALAFWSPV